MQSKIINCQVSLQLLERVRVYREKTGSTLSEFIRRALDEYLKAAGI